MGTALQKAIMERLVGLSDDLATVLSATILAGRSLLILGEHGCGKSTFCELIAKLFGMKSEQWVYYNAAVDDMVSVMGIPKLDTRPGEPLRFIPHARSIWDKQLVLVDEITRAAPENQNMWLEIVNQGTLKGEKLSCRFLIATCNPSSYLGAFELDQALLDRFAVVCPFPSMRQVDESAWVHGVLVNVRRRQAIFPSPEEVRALVRRFELVRQELLADDALVTSVANWVACLVHHLHKVDTIPLISGRSGMCLLPGVLFDIWAYRQLAQNRPLTAQEQKHVCLLAAQYALQHKLNLHPHSVKGAVDLAWELHLTHQPDPWKRFCCMVEAAATPREKLELVKKQLQQYPAEQYNPEQRTYLATLLRSLATEYRDDRLMLKVIMQISEEISHELTLDIKSRIAHMRMVNLLET